MKITQRQFWEPYCDHFCSSPAIASWFSESRFFRVAYYVREHRCALQMGGHSKWKTIRDWKIRYSRDEARAAANIALLLADHWREMGWKGEKTASRFNSGRI